MPRGWGKWWVGIPPLDGHVAEGESFFLKKLSAKINVSLKNKNDYWYHLKHKNGNYCCANYLKCNLKKNLYCLLYKNQPRYRAG